MCEVILFLKSYHMCEVLPSTGTHINIFMAAWSIYFRTYTTSRVDMGISIAYLKNRSSFFNVCLLWSSSSNTGTAHGHATDNVCMPCMCACPCIYNTIRSTTVREGCGLASFWQGVVTCLYSVGKNQNGNQVYGCVTVHHSFFPFSLCTSRVGQYIRITVIPW